MRDPKHILITGASSGLGAALADAYASPGIRLSLHGRNYERLSKVAAAAGQKGATVTTRMGDVTDGDALAGWMRECEELQPIDLVIANAGISPGLKTGYEGEEHVRSVLRTNIMGAINTILPAIPLMKPRRRGQIAIVASLAGFRGFSGAASYCASKAAIRIYGEALRSDLAPNLIEVNVICPGFIKTPMTDHNPFPMPLLMSAERAAQIIKKGLARNKARIAFPWIMHLLVQIAALLPQDFLSRLTTGMRKRPGKG